MRAFYTLILTLLCTLSPALAQQRSGKLEISVAAPGEDLKGQEVNVTHTEYGISYGYLVLDQEGKASLSVYPGENVVTISRKGYVTATEKINVAEGQTRQANITLREDVKAPTALGAEYTHDVFTGKGSVKVGWNIEPDVFFDDFESYDPWSIQFGLWTGIDGDGDMAAKLVGEYPNANTKQYATIVNPMTVEPTWWYDYPILRPFSGTQYAGFIRTNTGVANNDWLITPTITPGKDNVFEFLVRAADVYNEKYQVYITTKVDNPGEDDFIKISEGNYETATYKGWHRAHYDISAYEGMPVKFAIRYISSANNGGAFMLMVDNVRVGSSTVNPYAAARRVASQASAKSAANPNESFIISLDGIQVGTTDEYSYTITDVAPGNHEIGVKAKYLNAESSESTLNLTIDPERFCNFTVTLTHPKDLAQPTGTVTFTDLEDATSVSAAISDELTATFPSLPFGKYSIEIAAEPGYQTVEQTLEVAQKQQTLSVELGERIVTPSNLATATDPDTGDVTVTWNRNAAFFDSFEDYPDFAQHAFGDWLSIDLDGRPVYPISLGGSIITFPGCATQDIVTSIAPVVFNASQTEPSMLPTDVAMTAPTGEKQILFFSPQSNGANKWLISPALDVMDGYVMRVTAKSYTNVYPESLEFAVTTDLSGEPSTMEVVAEAQNMPADQWMIYEVDMSRFAGQKVRCGIHYVSFDTFFAQLDDFYLGNGQAAGDVIDTGNVIEYEVALDGSLHSKTTATEIRLKGLSEGTHTVGVTALYATGRSRTAEVQVNVSSGVLTIDYDQTLVPAKYYRLDGIEVSEPLAPGIYLERRGEKTRKIVVR